MLLGYALRLEYGDDVDKFKSVTPEAAKEAAVAKPILNTGNPLDNLDPNADEFRYIDRHRFNDRLRFLTKSLFSARF